MIESRIVVFLRLGRRIRRTMKMIEIPKESFVVSGRRIITSRVQIHLIGIKSRLELMFKLLLK